MDCILEMKEDWEITIIHTLQRIINLQCVVELMEMTELLLTVGGRGLLHGNAITMPVPHPLHGNMSI